MASNEYRLILSALIDEKSLGEQVSGLSKKYTLNLDVKINDKEINEIKNQVTQIQKTIGSSGKGMKVIDTEDGQRSLEALYQRIKEIRESVDKTAKFTVSTSVSSSGEQIQKAMISYTDQAGKAVRETMQLVKTEEMVAGQIKEVTRWQLTSKQYTEDIVKAEKMALAEEEKRNKELEKATLYADKFLERSKNLEKTPEVTQGISLAGQVKTAAGEGDIESVRKLSRELNVLDSGIRQAGVSAWSWSEQMKVAIQRTVEWATSMALIYGALRQIKEGIQYITDLNKEMTNLRVVTGISQEEANRLAGSYNTLAKEMGATTLEVAKGSLEWARQGKSVGETDKLLRATLMMSKLGAIDSAQATEYLTSTLNGFNLSADDAEGVVDKLVKYLPEHIVIYGTL